jgi:hypothetical protein
VAYLSLHVCKKWLLFLLFQYVNMYSIHDGVNGYKEITFTTASCI